MRTVRRSFIVQRIYNIFQSIEKDELTGSGDGQRRNKMSLEP